MDLKLLYSGHQCGVKEPIVHISEILEIKPDSSYPLRQPGRWPSGEVSTPRDQVSGFETDSSPPCLEDYFALKSYVETNVTPAGATRKFGEIARSVSPSSSDFTAQWNYLYQILAKSRMYSQ
ncbi:hypothetical protein AVEN_46452-1 [Araneus ventricosus]|uniref:Uncharacterized protein n=1 Tax=Araneus ventricosus TaxID=182803 RepID=A0A4Y2J1T9_ARAVE|nr:hypothetical protein AVEN_46452-1 [Araneus ventricosus]